MANRKDQVEVSGLAAARALGAARPDDVIRIHLVEERIDEFRDLLRFCAAKRRPYKIVSAEDVARVAGGVHHEGIVITARPKPILPFEEAVRPALAPAAAGPILVLVDIRNPHNAGAILRTAAHFGAAAVVFAGEEAPETLAPSAYRMAEGGAEALRLGRATDAAAALRHLAENGATTVAAAVRNAASLYETDLPPRTAFVLGPEREGLSPETMDLAAATVTIPGTGAVESLNVAAAAAVLLSEFHARRLRPRA